MCCQHYQHVMHPAYRITCEGQRRVSHSENEPRSLGWTLLSCRVAELGTDSALSHAGSSQRRHSSMARIHSMTIEAPITKVMSNCCWSLSDVLYWNTMAQGSSTASGWRRKAVLASTAASSLLLPVNSPMLWAEFSQGCTAGCPPCGQLQHNPF